MTNRTRATIDDGTRSELISGTDFDGFLGVPTIKKPREIIIPSRMIPFSQRSKATGEKDAICFFEKDVNFADVLHNPQDYINEFKGKIIVSPDCSLYTDASYSVAVINTYRSRGLGYYFQQNGAYVLPLVRWGNELTFNDDLFPDKLAFLGVEKHSIYVIGTYGCIQGKRNQEIFKSGLKSMIDTLKPETILVYGAMPSSVFDDFKKDVKFVHYSDWITCRHGGGQNG